MRVPLGWLREYCDPGTSAEEIADVLTMAGDKLERLHRVGVGDARARKRRRALAAIARRPVPKSTSDAGSGTSLPVTVLVVMSGANLDSVESGPCINDNVSGSAALLDTALQMS